MLKSIEATIGVDGEVHLSEPGQGVRMKLRRMKGEG